MLESIFAFMFVISKNKETIFICLKIKLLILFIFDKDCVTKRMNEMSDEEGPTSPPHGKMIMKLLVTKATRIHRYENAAGSEAAMNKYYYNTMNVPRMVSLTDP